MDIATVSVVASGVVAAASIAAGVVQHQRGLAHQRQLADLENVRGVLDNAAGLLHQAAYALDDVRVGLMQHGGSFFSDTKAEEAYGRLETIGQECDLHRERLAVRFGRDHEAVKAFGGANEAVLAIYRALGVIKFEDRSSDDHSAQQQVRQIIRKQRVEITAQRGVFDDQRTEFMDIAARVAGARLPRT